MLKSLKERLSPPDFKKLTEDSPIKQMGAPKEVILPLQQHTGTPAQLKITKGDKVKVGTLIAEAKDYISAPLHSSISGEVKEVEKRPHPVLGQSQAIVIESDGRDILDEGIKDRTDIDSLCADELRKIIREAGIVGLGGAAFPTHVKLAPPKDKPIDTFILNGAECEPFLTCDYRLMLEKSKEILAGMKIAMKVLGVTFGFVAIEENKPQAINLFKRLVEGKNIKVAVLKSFYPQGAEKQLIKIILKREVPPQGLPFDVGVVVHNVATCLAIDEAVSKNKPLYERVITVSGRILRNPSNILVRIGTKVGEIIEFCGGLLEEPAKVILGGPMMGVAQYTLDVPIIKGTSGIIVFGKKEVKDYLPQACIRCTRCIQVCPLGLNPSQIAQAVEKERYDLAKTYNVLDCIECGICEYVCPAKRRITQSIKRAKLQVR